MKNLKKRSLLHQSSTLVKLAFAGHAEIDRRHYTDFHQVSRAQVVTVISGQVVNPMEA